MTRTTEYQRQFVTPRMRVAFPRQTLCETSPSDEPVSLYAGCRGMVRDLPNLAGAQRPLARIGGAS